MQAASRTYFSRPASALDLRRSALLAGLPQAPTDYDPLLHPHRARERRDEVLDQMHSQGYINGRQRHRAEAAGLGLDPGERYTTVHDPYFFDYVQQQLIRALRSADGARRRPRGPDHARPPATGARAGRGRRRRRDGSAGRRRRWWRPTWRPGTCSRWRPPPTTPTDQFNIAADGHRQPGSAFKPFVLATALEQGINPYKTYLRRLEPGDPVPVRPRGRAMDRQQRRARRGADERHPGDHGLRERRVRTARPRRRPGERRRDRALAGDHQPARRLSLRGHRRPAGRRLPAGDVERLRELRRRRRPPPGFGDRERGLPGRPGIRSAPTKPQRQLPGRSTGAGRPRRRRC